ncbi:Zinc finger CCCH domain-containing protein 25 [Acorus calamus]|uniref:Zinc finger CCCH domain-containing protein 25 n=1 Tax=Acorus calamus TaxID=4465 RepID=A0AAV9DB01_ACOCL|nr:Zinc finger CCCH domain-containing protein 25 [Acorus calamus]
MNPLTLVKRTQKINLTEANLGISDDASWHAKYKDSAYVFVGGIPYDLTEGDLLAVFAQYGEIVDVNLVRDKGTGKSKGFAFLAYEDQRSTTLVVDNLNGARVGDRIVRVDHVSNYKKKEEEDEEEERKKREARGVCRAFQKGECNRGDSCRFSHDEQRNANTGWGEKDGKDSGSRWDHEKFAGPIRSQGKSGQSASDHNNLEKREFGGNNKRLSAVDDNQVRISRLKFKDPGRRDDDRHEVERSPEQKERKPKTQDQERTIREEYSGRHKTERLRDEDRARQESKKRSRYDADASGHRYRESDEGRQRSRSDKGTSHHR